MKNSGPRETMKSLFYDLQRGYLETWERVNSLFVSIGKCRAFYVLTLIRNEVVRDKIIIGSYKNFD